MVVIWIIMGLIIMFIGCICFWGVIRKKIDIGLFKIISNCKILILGKEFFKEGVIFYY